MLATLVIFKSIHLKNNPFFLFIFEIKSLSLPWDQETLMGWIYESVFCCLIGSNYLCMNFSVLTFFIGVALFNRAFYKYFEALSSKFDEISDADHVRIKLQIVKIVRFHIMAKE